MILEGVTNRLPVVVGEAPKPASDSARQVHAWNREGAGISGEDRSRSYALEYSVNRSTVSESSKATPVLISRMHSSIYALHYENPLTVLE